MNRSRVIILVLAAFAAGAVALIMRSVLGGGTEHAKAALAPSPAATINVLVAASEIQAGTALTPDMVRWQSWPKSSVDSSFIAQQDGGDVSAIVKGTVAREPLLEGEPLSNTKVIHADQASFMSARLSEGMRAVSTAISTETGAGGFILPNDRVDVLVTQQVPGGQRLFATRTILTDVRVLAMDQTFGQDKDRKTVLAKTATLELSPEQATKLTRAAASGTISLTLRALGDNNANAKVAAKAGHDDDGQVMVIRYGISRGGAESGGN
ncbi:MAG: Flp pilus assembly protein CpaB [Rhizomicrobium sp.]